MRSVAEVQFRLWQEAANLFMLVRQPGFAGSLPWPLALPGAKEVAGALRGTPYAKAQERLAEEIVAHRFPVLGIVIESGKEIQWRRDYIHDKDSGLSYFRRIPYLSFEATGDHKLVWEINRHQHLVVLAQAYLLTDRQIFLDEIAVQLRSWTAQNPFQRGINWASALEVAFRAHSWIWIWHLVGKYLPDDAQRSMARSLYQHGLHLSENLSVYFSPNTHLLGEAVVLYALGKLFPSFPGASSWRAKSERIVLEQLEIQVKPDGSHFEQSTYYHVYAVDFFILFFVLAGQPRGIEPVLLKMVDYLHCLLGTRRAIHFFGDDDGGRLFHPYGERSCFGRATVATCSILFQKHKWAGTLQDVAEQGAWWLGRTSLDGAREQVSGLGGARTFADCGTVFFDAGEFRLQMDCGPFGFGGAGHSHSDSLSLTLEFRGEPILVDPGTFTYISDIAVRNWFRGSGAHSTVRVDGLDQADRVNPFRWAGKPQVTLSQVTENTSGWFVDAVCEYHGVKHRRRVLINDCELLVLDDVDVGAGEHFVEQIWQLAPKAREVYLSTSETAIEQASWFSPAYGCKLESRSLTASVKGSGRLRLAMRLSTAPIGKIDVQAAEARLAGIF